jgi:catechol 2,3-dioxygenase-like lactoylglutathione lyase family enzyme
MDIGHVHLNVSDLDRSIAFYRDVLGLNVMLRMPKFAFLFYDGYHHHVALDSRAAANWARRSTKVSTISPCGTRPALSWRTASAAPKPPGSPAPGDECGRAGDVTHAATALNYPPRLTRRDVSYGQG